MDINKARDDNGAYIEPVPERSSGFVWLVVMTIQEPVK
jgi:hypothetical protein